MYDYLIVGAGLFGATFAHEAKRHGKSCLVIDKRQHLGGNVYCEKQDGINVHVYGAHIFHTNDKDVWAFVNRFADFNRYTNSPVAKYGGRLYNLPFNMNTFAQMWGVHTPAEAEQKLAAQRAEVQQMLQGREPANLEEQALSLVGRDIYEVLIKGYTEKQWGRPCSQLPAFIIKRLPLRMTFDNNYFNDTYQGIPIGGYNVLVERMLEGVETRTGVNFFDDRNYWMQQARKVVFTGCIDEYFNFCLGHLQYRTVRFEHERMATANYQGNAVVNYTERQVPFTRIIEHKHFECFGDKVYDIPTTIISREYSTEWKPGMEPYYPINNAHNGELYQSYKEMADAEANTIFGGRLAEYRYYDMAPVIARALEVCASEFKGEI